MILKHCFKRRDVTGINERILIWLLGILCEECEVKIFRPGTSLVVQWVRLCAPNAGGLGSIPGLGTRSHMHATTKTWCSQKNNK